LRKCENEAYNGPDDNITETTAGKSYSTCFCVCTVPEKLRSRPNCDFLYAAIASGSHSPRMTSRENGGRQTVLIDLLWGGSIYSGVCPPTHPRTDLLKGERRSWGDLPVQISKIQSARGKGLPGKEPPASWRVASGGKLKAGAQPPIFAASPAHHDPPCPPLTTPAPFTHFGVIEQH
jgi:hypothetical protein